MSLYPAGMSLLAERPDVRHELPVADTLDVLRAVAEPTRLRIVALLDRGDLSVTDLTEVLGQSQPRVSRHLKLLADARVVTRQREGAWAFYRLVEHDPIAALVAEILAVVDPADSELARDLARLHEVRERRAEAAAEYFERIAPIWDEERSLHASQHDVEAAILDEVGPGPLGRVLDLGTGTGRMLQLLADRAERLVGLDASHSMLAVARANVGDLTTPCELRQGDVYLPPLPPAGFDLVVIHQVLHYLDDPGRAILEAGRMVAPDGRLLVVDFAPHAFEFLRESSAHRRLGFDDADVASWLGHAGLSIESSRTLRPPSGDRDSTDDGPTTGGLTVMIWTARRQGSSSRNSQGTRDEHR